MATLLSARRTHEIEIREAGPVSYFPSGARFLKRLWSYIVRFAVGTGVKQRDRGFQRQYTIAAGATQEIDLASALADIYGGTVTFAKLCDLRVLNHSTTLTLTVGPNATNGFGGSGAWWSGTTPTQTVALASGEDEPGEYYANNPAGATVTGGTGDKLAITAAAGSGSATVTVQLLGKSA